MIRQLVQGIETTPGDLPQGPPWVHLVGDGRDTACGKRFEGAFRRWWGVDGDVSCLACWFFLDDDDDRGDEEPTVPSGAA